MASLKIKGDYRIEGELLVPNETASRALHVDSFGKIKSSSVTSTELGYLSGVTSSIQTQLNTGATNLSNHLSDASDAHDASAISNIPAGNLAASDVQSALNELQGDIDTNATGLSDHLSDTVDAHDASAISNAPSGNLAATTVQAALNELQGDIDALTGGTGLADHLSDTVDAHDASAISSIASGNLAATDVQSALNELQSDIDGRASSTLLDGKVYIGNVSNVATAQTISGDISIDNAGVAAIASGVIVDADINASAAITRSKLSSGTANRILVNNASGVMTENQALTANKVITSNTSGLLASSGVTTTELLTLVGVTSDIQPQLNAKLSTALGTAQIRIGSAGGIATARDVGGDLSVTSLGVFTVGDNVITDVKIHTSANIQRSKIAAGTINRIIINNATTGKLTENAAITASRALESDANGLPIHSATTSVELGYVSGVTSAIQTQLNTGATNLSNHLSDAIDAHDASAISNVPSGNLVATDVQAALNELQSEIDTITGGTGLSDHLSDATDAHDASAISSVASGNLAATDVQSALNELQSDIDTRALDSAVIKKDGSVAFTAAQSMGGFKLTSLGAPTASSDAATKLYVDNALEGLKPKAAVRVASAAAGTLASSFENGDSVDGITLVTGDRILLKDQASASENGIYIVAASGAPARASDFDSISPIDEVNGSIVAVQEGTANAGKIFVQQGAVATLGTDPVNFVFFNSTSGLVGGDGITISGSNVSIDHDGNGLTFNAGVLSLELNGGTLYKDPSGLRLGTGGITNTHVNAVAGIYRSKLADGTAYRLVANDGSGAMSEAAAITGSRALVSDTNGIPTHSTVTTTELGYVSGVTSGIQAQLNAITGSTALSDHLSDAVDAHDASAISSVASGNLAATDVQSALNELQSDIDSRALSSVTLSGAANGGIASTIGDLSASRSISLDASNLTASTSFDNADSLVIYDDSATGTRKMTRANFLSDIARKSSGDLDETSFSAADNQVAAANVTGLAFANGTVRSFKAQVSIFIDATTDLYEMFELHGIQKGSSWDLAQTSVGDDSGFVFTITTGGQIQYSSPSSPGFVSSTLKFRAQTTSV